MVYTHVQNSAKIPEQQKQQQQEEYSSIRECDSGLLIRNSVKITVRSINICYKQSRILGRSVSALVKNNSDFFGNADFA